MDTSYRAYIEAGNMPSSPSFLPVKRSYSGRCGSVGGVGEPRSLWGKMPGANYLGSLATGVWVSSLLFVEKLVLDLVSCTLTRRFYWRSAVWPTR